MKINLSLLSTKNSLTSCGVHFMRVISIMLLCLGLVACVGQFPPEKERAAEAKAQKALLAPKEEFYDLNRARKFEIERNAYREQSP